MAKKFALLSITAGFMLAAASAGHAQGYYGGPYPGYVHPNVQPYGPGVYAERGRAVNVPRGCYATREQVRVGNQLVWRPLVTCPYDDYR